LVPRNTERVVLTLFRASNISYISQLATFITSSNVINQFVLKVTDFEVVRYIIDISSTVFQEVLTSASKIFNAFTALMDSIFNASIVLLYSLFLGVMPLKAAWYALSWQLPLDTLVLAIGLLLVLEALKAFCSMVQAFMVELGSRLMSLEDYILPPKETLRFFIFSTPPSLEVLDASSLPRSDGKNDTSALIDAAISFADKGAHTSLQEVLSSFSASSSSSSSLSASSVPSTLSGCLVPQSAVCDVVFYRHVDGTPGVGKFRPRPGTWAQVIASKNPSRDDNDASSTLNNDEVVLPPEIPLPTGCRGAGAGGEGPDTGF
jgi:hypothetical protein